MLEKRFGTAACGGASASGDAHLASSNPDEAGIPPSGVADGGRQAETTLSTGTPS